MKKIIFFFLLAEKLWFVNIYLNREKLKCTKNIFRRVVDFYAWIIQRNLNRRFDFGKNILWFNAMVLILKMNKIHPGAKFSSQFKNFGRCVKWNLQNDIRHWIPQIFPQVAEILNETWLNFQLQIKRKHSPCLMMKNIRKYIPSVPPKNL